MTVPASDLVELGTGILTAVGVPRDDAALVADSLVTADMWGHPSHGMLRLGWYVERIRSGAMRPVTEVATVVDGGAVAVLDGRDGVGQVITARAAREAVRRAGEHGVGAVAVRGGNHFGTAAYFTRMMADEGCVAILTTNGSPAMAPWGGRAKTVGANPWSIAVPGGVVLDISNTTVARGKIYAALERGETLPDGWAIGPDGTPATDPRTALDGLVLPMAGHKGYGIAFMMDVLSGVLTGSSYATGVAGPYVPDRRSGCGHLLIALRVEAFLDRGEFDRRLGDLIGLTKAVPLAPGFEEIFHPGEIEDRNAAAAARDGVALPAKTRRDLDRLARSCGIDAAAVLGPPGPREAGA
ncbi:Ldh family oxidoreductase [Actinomadura keratinilytica]|jgi:LDH2 family malate/lactate/ureidoglycolate dehydrogenase|uniref:Ldh family oxidoreductase n=1 Tax=Actinomadura keratinilytica TaxID=547461 RepID=UPI0031EAD34E